MADREAPLYSGVAGCVEKFFVATLERRSGRIHRIGDFFTARDAAAEDLRDRRARGAIRLVLVREARVLELVEVST